MSQREQLLAELRSECGRGDAARILGALDALMVWLAAPENNTDFNCRAVDRFVFLEVLDKMMPEQPDGLRELLLDVGGQLHDTHTAPSVASSFESTPEQLLARTRQLSASLGPRG